MEKILRGDERPENRKIWILDQVDRHDEIGFQDVSGRFGRSAAQNDLRDLTMQGILVRVSHGRYKRPEVSFREDVFGPGPYREKRQRYPAEKQALARHIVAEHCRHVRSLGLDAGTTSTAVAEELVDKRITMDNVFTSNLDAVLLFMNAPQIGHIQVKGGGVVPRHAAICGAMLSEEEKWGIEMSIIGTSGIFVKDEDEKISVELSTEDISQHPFKQWLFRAPTVIIPTTSDKIGRSRGDCFAAIRETARNAEYSDGRHQQQRIVIAVNPITPEDFERIQKTLTLVKEKTGALVEVIGGDVPMPHARYTSEEIVRRGEEIYDREIRDRVEAGNKGKYLVLDIETSEYEIDKDMLAALDRAKVKHPDPALYILRVGFPAVAKLGGRSLVKRP